MKSCSIDLIVKFQLLLSGHRHITKKNKKEIEDIAQGVYDCMSTDLGKDRILNPPDLPPRMKVE